MVVIDKATCTAARYGKRAIEIREKPRQAFGSARKFRAHENAARRQLRRADGPRFSK